MWGGGYSKNVSPTFILKIPGVHPPRKPPVYKLSCKPLDVYSQKLEQNSEIFEICFFKINICRKCNA